MTIIHISNDYPDTINPEKTRAISNLVEATSNVHDHLVYSLNRVSTSPISPLGNIRKPAGQRVEIKQHGRSDKLISWSYNAPAKSLFLKTAMLAIGEQIAEDIQRQGITPSIIQGHKLTMEGIAARHAARLLKVPFAISVQGNSDQSISRVRRDLWPLYKRIFHEAAIVFSFSPWALNYLEGKFGKRSGLTQMLPCITYNDRLLSPRKTGNRILSAFHLKNWRLKNMPALVSAAENLDGQVEGFSLEIFGGGDDADVAHTQSCVNAASTDAIKLRGAIAGGKIQAEMNSASGFAMLSRKESFGMVFVEALLAGCPVVYPAGAAIDGYFDDHNFAIAAPANDQAAINDAILKLLMNQDRLKAELKDWQESGAATSFQHHEIANHYANQLRKALKDKKIA